MTHDSHTPSHDPPAGPPALAVHGLRARYDATGPWIVSIDQLTLAPREQTLMTGRSGSGKTTLLSLLCGLMDPNEGTIRIAGTDIHALHGARRDRFRGAHIGVIFQQFNLLLGFSALENVMLPMLCSDLPPKEHANRAKDLLTSMEITRVNQPVQDMSVGMQQRVAVARALACSPSLVLADEPTASLDPETGEAAIRTIKSACERAGAALLCVSHDPAMTAHFTNHIRLEDLTTSAATP